MLFLAILGIFAPSFLDLALKRLFTPLLLFALITLAPIFADLITSTLQLFGLYKTMLFVCYITIVLVNLSIYAPYFMICIGSSLTHSPIRSPYFYLPNSSLYFLCLPLFLILFLCYNNHNYFALLPLLIYLSLFFLQR